MTTSAAGRPTAAAGPARTRCGFPAGGSDVQGGAGVGRAPARSGRLGDEIRVAEGCAPTPAQGGMAAGWVAFYHQPAEAGRGPERGGACGSTSSEVRGVDADDGIPWGVYGVAVGTGGAGIAGPSLTVVDAAWAAGGPAAQAGPAVVSLDRSVVAAVLPHARPLHGTLLPRHPSALLGEALAALARGAAPAIGAGRIVAALRAASLDGAGSRPAAGTHAARRFRARLFIDAHIGRAGLDVGAVARGAGMSRSSLYRAFETDGGVEREIVRRRVARLRSALLDPGEARSVAALASELGFASASHASRAFSAAYGVAPGQLRANSARARAALGDARSTGSGALPCPGIPTGLLFYPSVPIGIAGR